MAGGVVAPVLPEMVQELRLDPVLAANLVSIHCLTIALFSPPLGILADRVGRLRILIPSLVCYALFGICGAFMQDIGPLLLSRGLLGAASGGIAASSLGILSSFYEGQTRSQALGYATSTLTITGILFPLLGGWAGSEHWQYAFWLYGLGLPLAALAALVLRAKPAKPKPSAKPKPAAKLGKVIGHPYALQLLLMLGLASVSMYAVVIYAPLYLKTTLGVNTLMNGILLAFRAVGAATISAFGARRIAQRLGLGPATGLGFGCMALTLATIPLLRDFNWIVVAAIGFGVGFGLVLPNLYSALADFAPENQRSSVLAAGTGAGFLGQFLSPILLAPVLDRSGLTGVFYAAAAIAASAGLSLVLFGRKPPSIKPDQSAI